jgi:hypothetical protein
VPRPSNPALVTHYAARFDTAFGDGSHTVGSPLGAWLLLALVAPAATGADRSELEAVLGTDVDDAFARAAELLGSPHPSVATAIAVWHRSTFLLPTFFEWARTLPSTTETGEVPSQEVADAWADRITDGIIRRFPLELDEEIVILFANALATRVEWTTSFEVAPSAALGAPWAAQVEQVLNAPEEHTLLIAGTERAGDVAVHAATSTDGLLVVSVIADAVVPPADVRAAAHQLGAALAASSTLGARSLFDLPLGDGHAWSITERQVTPRDGESEPDRETYTGLLPAWTASGDHDLLGQGPALGFPAACQSLGAFCRGRVLYEAKQVAAARFDRRGFEAAAITSIAVRVSAPPPGLRTVPQRHATLRFHRPYAVVALAVDPAGGPWHGVPVFSAWVAEPSEPFDEPTSGE